jgi:hypothetical protein
VDPLVSVTGQPYAFTNDDPLNAKDPLGLYVTGGGSSECNTSGGTIDCTGSTSNGVSVAGSYSPSTGAATGAFTPATEASDEAANVAAAAPSASAVAAEAREIAAEATAAAAKAAAAHEAALLWARSEINAGADCFGTNMTGGNGLGDDSGWSGDCSPASIAASGGFFGCAEGIGGGACSGNQWVKAGDRSPGTNPMTGSDSGSWGTAGIGAGAGCLDGAGIGSSIGPEGTVGGCVIVGVFEGGVDLILKGLFGA